MSNINQLTFKGKIVNISDAQQVTDTFRKREFVLMYAENPTYPEEVKFEMIQDNCDNLNGYASGEDVEIDVNIKGRRWNDPKNNNAPKWFNTLQAWRIRKASDTQAAPAAQDDETNDLGF